MSGMEVLAGSLHEEQRRKADAFLTRLSRRDRIIPPTHEEWLQAGMILARYQNRFGHVAPADHAGDILILLAAERLRSDLVTENGKDFRLWSKFRAPSRRPRLVVVDRQEHLNANRAPHSE